MEEIDVHLELLTYLVDILRHMTAAAKMIQKLRSVLDLCHEKSLKLSPDKCDLVNTLC